MPLLNFYLDTDDKELLESIIDVCKTKKLKYEVMLCSLLLVALIIFIFIFIYNVKPRI